MSSAVAKSTLEAPCEADRRWRSAHARCLCPALLVLALSAAPLRRKGTRREYGAIVGAANWPSAPCARHIADAVAGEKPGPFKSKGSPRHCEDWRQVRDGLLFLAFICFAGTLLCNTTRRECVLKQQQTRKHRRLVRDAIVTGTMAFTLAASFSVSSAVGLPGPDGGGRTLRPNSVAPIRFPDIPADRDTWVP